MRAPTLCAPRRAGRSAEDRLLCKQEVLGSNPSRSTTRLNPAGFHHGSDSDVPPRAGTRHRRLASGDESQPGISASWERLGGLCDLAAQGGVSIITRADKSIANQYAHDDFGGPRARTEHIVGNDYAFTGREHDSPVER